MKFKFQPRGADELKRLARELPQRFHNVAVHLGRTIALHALDEVKSRVPNRPGWYGIYRQALGAAETDDGTRFAVVGDGVVPPSLPAESTLLDFDASTPLALVLNPYNPWAIDAIPPIAGGYETSIVVRVASPAEVASERERLRPLLPLIRTQLTSAGATILVDGALVEIRGVVYTDVVWMAHRLETGAGGFEKRPHWGPAADITAKLGLRWGQAEAARVEEILSGGAPPSNLPIVSDQRMSSYDERRNPS